MKSFEVVLSFDVQANSREEVFRMLKNVLENLNDPHMGAFTEEERRMNDRIGDPEMWDVEYPINY